MEQHGDQSSSLAEGPETPPLAGAIPALSRREVVSVYVPLSHGKAVATSLAGGSDGSDETL
jgi:hypothetical protein|eukprot:SAG25_NODE_1134_length_3833_cov_1.526245_2_plen_61_part_00